MTRPVVRLSTHVAVFVLLAVVPALAVAPVYEREPLPNVLTYSRPLAVSDLTGDQKLDLLVLGSSGLFVVPGDGSGEFPTWQRAIADKFPTSQASAADFNGDGLLDVVTVGVLDANNTTRGSATRVFLGQAGGTFAQTAYYGSDRTSSVNAPGIGDFNRDGRPDFVLARLESYARASGGIRSRGAIDVYLGDGNGGFTGPLVTADGGDFYGVFSAGDLDGDGATDIFTLSNEDDSYYLWLSDGAGGFRPRTSLIAPAAPRSASREGPPRPAGTVVGDFAGIGRRDLLVRFSYRGFDPHDPFGRPLQFSARYFSDGAGGYSVPVVLDEPREHWRSVVSQAVGDVNGDGIDDIVLSGPNSFKQPGPLYGIQPATDVYLGTGYGAFNGPVLTAYTGGMFNPTAPNDARLHDLNGDGRLDLITHEPIAGFNVAFGDGAGGFGPRHPTGNYVNYWDGGSAAADFNGDGIPDIAVTNGGSFSVSVWLGDGAGGFSGPTSVSTGYGHAPIAIVAADLNGDGRVDLATASVTFRGAHAEIAVLDGDGQGGFGPPRALAATEPSALVAGDFDRDGSIDLAAANNSRRTVDIYYDMPGEARRVTLTDPVMLPDDGSPSVLVGLAAADFDENGWPDLVRSSASGAFSLFLNVGNPALQSVRQVTVGGPNCNIVAGDLDGDGHADVIVPAFKGGGSAGLFTLLGDGAGGFAAPVSQNVALVVAPQNAVLADLDGHGQRAVLVNLYSGLSVFLVGPGGLLQPAGAFRNDSTSGMTRSIPVVDLDGDGLADVVLPREVLFHVGACGNGNLDSGEECDDGNNDACDGCSPRCRNEVGASCGDGVVNSACLEICDAGAQNSNTQPNACRTDCHPPRCGDGVLDAGEECDDGNSVSCDGCSASCRVDSVPVCGDGVANVACGEQCDDGNAVAADGCAPNCRWETIPGGGGTTTDCHLEWLTANPHNAPLLDRNGRYRHTQTCHDNDPACDLDGGVTNSCTMRFALCTNVVDDDVPRCWPQPLRSATVIRPSEREASVSPVRAEIRSTLRVLAQEARRQPAGHCTDWATVSMPLGTQLLKVRMTSTWDSRDSDSLTLRCVP